MRTVRRRNADPERPVEELAAALRRWSALLGAGLTAAEAWEATARTLPACHAPGPGCCLHHRLRRRASGERLGVPSVPEDAPGSAWALVDAALAAGRRAGVAPAAVAARLADTLGASVDAARARRSAAAGPRATARMLQWLPVGGLVLAWLLGTSPADLLSTPLGWIVGVTGLLFAAAGRSWTRILLERAAREPGLVDTAVLLDLTSPLLSAGRSLTGALEDLAHTLPGAERLRPVTTLLAWGRPWEEAWAPVAGHPPWCEAEPWLRPLHRSGMAGAATLTATAAAVRQQARRADERAAEELAVSLVLPVSLCQLPAFVCWGVVPLGVALLGG